MNRIAPEPLTVETVKSILMQDTVAVSQKSSCFGLFKRRVIQTDDSEYRLSDIARVLSQSEHQDELVPVVQKLFKVYLSKSKDCQKLRQKYELDIEVGNRKNEIAELRHGKLVELLDTTANSNTEFPDELQGIFAPTVKTTSENALNCRSTRDYRKIKPEQAPAKLKKAYQSAQEQIKEESDGSFTLEAKSLSCSERIMRCFFRSSPSKVSTTSINPYPKQDEIQTFLKGKSKLLCEDSRHEKGSEYLRIRGRRVGIAFDQNTGERAAQMQDEHLAIPFDITVQGKNYKGALFGVFDGHGDKDAENSYEVGRLAAMYAKEFFPRILKARLEKENANGLSDAGMMNAIKLATVDLHEEFALASMEIVNTDEMKQGHMANQRNQFRSGTTATFLLDLEGLPLYAGNVGDSRMLIVPPSGDVIGLTTDAKIEDGWDGASPDYTTNYQEEKDAPFARSAWKRGGDSYDQLGQTGEEAASQRLAGKLATPRVIGDVFLNDPLDRYQIKDWKLADAGVNARAKVVKMDRNQIPAGSRITMSCDGIFEGASSRQIGKAVQNNRHIPADELARDIVEESISEENGASTDNCTLMIIDY